MFSLLVWQGSQTIESCPLSESYYILVEDTTKMSVATTAILSRVQAMTGQNLMKTKKGFVVTSASRGVIRTPSRGLFLIRDDERVRRDGRMEVGR
jgi:hypothetical protein